MENNKVSIIIPVYNVEHLLDKCVNSIIEQTHKNTEIILVNDGSTDNSKQVCNILADKYNFIKVIHQENAGQSAARNTGLKFITGNYLMFIDSDDWIELNMIETLLNYLKKYDAQVVECDLAYSNLNETLVPFDEEKHKVKIETRIDALKRIIKNQRFSVCVRMYTRSVSDGIKFVVGKNAPDVYFTSEVFNRAKKNVYLQYPFYNYYYNPASVTKKPYTLKKLDSLDAALYIEKNIKDDNIELKKTVASNLLYASTYHYKYINYYAHLDPDWKIRNRLKKLIDTNYFGDDTHAFGVKAAKYLPVKLFSFILSINKVRRRLTIR
ncbi:glycosyltransferase family 2 protein [Hyunsoonleella sp. 2307UL5-6]|uniref:glycosyltransferase family 2 protein n=1 Tax=Hyunsoonleella sp. 2307UL5-6 TaxID=3384768 RepID=UPI0039BC3A23